jgi:putative tryptophan/tyrosine transport system substrate-binding protein
MKRRAFIAALGGAAAWPLMARAQKSLPRIGWLVFGDAKKMGPIDQSLKDALAQAGLLDGRNVEIVFRYANGMPDRLAELATELVAQKPKIGSIQQFDGPLARATSRT